MKASIITVVRDNREYIKNCIDSVLSQDYPDIEYIVIDGASTDGTLDIIRSYGGRIAKIISEPDKGLYDALNKGIGLATGEVIGILHADDFYPSLNVVSGVVKEFERTGAFAVWGDLLYVDRRDTDKIIRTWKSSDYEPGNFQKGWMPPHPTFFAKRELYAKFGGFRLDFKTAADYELMLRFLEKNKASGVYLPGVLVKMRVGGMSNRNPISRFIASWNDYRAWKVNGLKINPFRILLKPISKIKQYFK